MADFVIDAASIKAFSARCRTVDRDIALAFNRSLDPAGDIVADEAVRLIAPFSKRIPGRIKRRRSGTRVRVIAGGDKAPHAAALDNRGKNGTFRHRVFGQDVWVNQPAHPFLEPAAESKQDEVGSIITEAVFIALQQL